MMSYHPTKWTHFGVEEDDDGEKEEGEEDDEEEEEEDDGGEEETKHVSRSAFPAACFV